MHKDIRVTITVGTIISALLIIAGGYLLWTLRGLVLLVIAAIVIASAIEPGISFFIHRGIHRFFSTVLIYVLMLGSVSLLLYLFFTPIAADAAGFFSSMSQYFDTLNASSSFQDLKNASSLIGAAQDPQSFIQILLSLPSLFLAGSSSAAQMLTTFFGGIFSLGIVFVLSFYFALQDTGVDDFLRLVMPVAYEDYSVDLWRRSQKKIGLWMQGQILLSLLVAVLVYLGLLIIGIPYALLLAVFTAFAEIIPIFGSLTAGTLAVIIAYSTGGLALSTVVAGLYIVVNQFESNLIYPLIVKKVVGVPPLLVIVALIAGGMLAGFLGVLLSVPLAAIMHELIMDFDKRKHRSGQRGS